MHSIEAVKIEVFFTSLNECSPSRKTFEMLESPSQPCFEFLKEC